MDTYAVTHAEYLRLLRFINDVKHTHMYGSLQCLLNDLVDCNVYRTDGMIDVPERLMRRVAIACMCDMSLVQYNDSNGEIDYACLGKYSVDILDKLLRSI